MTWFIEGLEIEAVADKGYYKGEEIVACELAGIAVTVSKTEHIECGSRGSLR